MNLANFIHIQRGCQVVIPVLCLGILFYLLPSLAAVPVVQERVEFNARHGINGNATFYTELDDFGDPKYLP